MSKSKKKLKGKQPTAKQRKLLKQIPDIIAGKKHATDAMRDAGYSENTVQEHSRVMGSVGIQQAMQEALDKAGVTLPKLAKKIRNGLDAKKALVHRGKIVNVPDHAVQHRYVETAIKVKDAYPSERADVKITGGISLVQVLQKADGQ